MSRSASLSLSESISASLSQSEFDSAPLNIESESETTKIDDEETPEVLAAGSPWWTWIPGVGGVLSIYDGLKNKKKEKNLDKKDSEE